MKWKRTKIFYSFFSSETKGELEYVIHIALLQIVNLVVAILLYAMMWIAYENRVLSNDGIKALLVVFGIALLISVFFYANICIQRIRDIGFKGSIIQKTFILYFVSMVIIGAIQYYSKNEIILMVSSYTFFLSIVSFWAFQFFLLVAPGDFADFLKKREINFFERFR
jgi:uncharacterized membrane protein YhaH (DUF805 family)